MGPNPTDRGRGGTERHFVTDRRGIPLAVRLTGANHHESTVFEDPLDAIPPIERPSGQRYRRPDKLHADEAYDVPRCRRALSRRRIKVRIAREGIVPEERFGHLRWAGWSSARWRGPTAPAGRRSATNATTRSTRRSAPPAAR